jgi:repressor LexA
MTEIKKIVGERVREAREEKGMTQKELADFLQYSPMGISHFEKGIREIKLSDLERLAGFFGKNISYFLSPGLTMFRAGDNNDSGMLESVTAFDKFISNRKKEKNELS